VVTRQLQVGRRTGKVRRPKTDVLPLSQRHQLLFHLILFFFKLMTFQFYLTIFHPFSSLRVLLLLLYRKVIVVLCVLLTFAIHFSFAAPCRKGHIFVVTLGQIYGLILFKLSPESQRVHVSTSFVFFFGLGYYTIFDFQVNFTRVHMLSLVEWR